MEVEVFGEANREPFQAYNVPLDRIVGDVCEVDDVGEVTLTIEPNRELRGKILLYGENLEVVQPLLLREQLKEIVMKQMELYMVER